MSDRERRIITIILGIFLPVVSFLGGYFTNDYVAFVRGNQGGAAVASAAGGDWRVFNEAWQLVNDNFLGEMPSDEQLSHALIRGAMASLGDPYTVFLEPVVTQEEQITLRGNFGGIGATIGRNEAGEVVLVPIPGNPAAEAGIVDGHILLAVDGVAIAASMSTEEIVQMVRGEKGTTVRLTVRLPDQEEAVEIAIVRGDILVPSVIARILPDQPTIGYIHLTRFSGESTREMEDALNQLQGQGVAGIVLDLRGNGGGLVEAAVEVADLFISTGDLLYQESKREGEHTYRATPGDLAPDIPLVVLVDGSTASAAEIVAGALQDAGRAPLLGSKTFGKGSVQLVFSLSDGSSVHITAARWYTPARRQIDQQGLEPNMVRQPTAEEAASGRDVLLEDAIRYLLGQ
jgi:carboxyl-terminal processing protease